MENAIRESNPSKARKVLDEALSSLDHTTPSSLEFVYDFCYAGVKAVRESLPGSTKPELQEKLMKVTSQSVRNCATLDELRRFMEEVLEALPGEEPAEHVYSSWYRTEWRIFKRITTGTSRWRKSAVRWE